MRQTGEPSVEEILESIKKVIARDNRAEAEQVRRRREGGGVMTVRTLPTPQADPVYDQGDGPAAVLELTDAQMAPIDDDDSEFAADEADDAMDEIDQNASEDPPSPAAEEPLLAANSRSSVRESLTALAMLAEPGARPQIVRSGETSLEGLAREMLRPMLAEWLDKNLPAMVDQLVAAEISRIVGKRG